MSTTLTTGDYIRKAVQLADGWHVSSDDCVTTDEFGGLAHPTESEILLDALAAQLVRQVDAIDAIYVMSYPDKSAVIDDGLLDVVGIHEGPDRTMNTIKAIIDSKVLE